MSTYQPAGKGLCGECGRDVGKHEDEAHAFCNLDNLCDAVVYFDPETRAELRCGFPESDPIHDVGRVLRCPEEER